MICAKFFFQGLIFALVFGAGCASMKPVLLPVPHNYTRPILNQGFFNCVEGNGEIVCLRFDDAQTLMKYVVETEVELRKCTITVEEVNKERK